MCVGECYTNRRATDHRPSFSTTARSWMCTRASPSHAYSQPTYLFFRSRKFLPGVHNLSPLSCCKADSRKHCAASKRHVVLVQGDFGETDELKSSLARIGLPKQSKHTWPYTTTRTKQRSSISCHQSTPPPDTLGQLEK